MPERGELDGPGTADEGIKPIVHKFDPRGDLAEGWSVAIGITGLVVVVVILALVFYKVYWKEEAKVDFESDSDDPFESEMYTIK